MTPYEEIAEDLTATRATLAEAQTAIASLKDENASLQTRLAQCEAETPAEDWPALVTLAQQVRDDADATLAAAQPSDQEPEPPDPEPPNPEGEGLIGSLECVGAFKLPHGQQGSSSFDYGATAMAYRKGSDSLFMVGHDWQQQATEVSIPAYFALDDPPALFDHLATAVMRQPFADVTDGQMMLVTNHPNEDSVKIGGLLPDEADGLRVSAFIYYDGNGEQHVSHFTSRQDLSVPDDARGPFALDAKVPDTNGNPIRPGGFVSGYMCWIPEAWREALGGQALAGNCFLSVIARTSDGPACFAFNPGDVGTIDPVPTTTLLVYPVDPDNGRALPPTGPDGTVWNNRTAQCTGIVFPEGTRSVLFFGRVGVGAYEYGQGTADPALDGQPVPGSPDTIYVYDPADQGKGGHAFPYEYRVWAYDAADLAKVRQGELLPWDVRPYAVWQPVLPYPVMNAQIKGAAYDPIGQRIFLSEAWGDGSYPIVYVTTPKPLIKRLKLRRASRRPARRFHLWESAR